MASLADVSRFLIGSDTLKFTPKYLKNFNIPSIQMSNPSLVNRSGVKTFLAADTMDFDALDLEVLLDGDFDTYFEIMDAIFSSVDYETGAFHSNEFDLWVVVNNSKDEPIFRIDFKGCRVNSIGSLALDPEAEPGATFNLNVSYHFYTWKRWRDCGIPQTPKTPKV